MYEAPSGAAEARGRSGYGKAVIGCREEMRVDGGTWARDRAKGGEVVLEQWKC